MSGQSNKINTNIRKQKTFGIVFHPIEFSQFSHNIQSSQYWHPLQLHQTIFKEILGSESFNRWLIGGEVIH